MNELTPGRDLLDDVEFVAVGRQHRQPRLGGGRIDQRSKRGKSPGEARFVDAGADRVRREAPQFPQLRWRREARSAPVGARAYRSARAFAPVTSAHRLDILFVDVFETPAFRQGARDDPGETVTVHFSFALRNE
jgi:hypothetical protein